MKVDKHGYHKLEAPCRFVIDLDRELWLACCGCSLVHGLKFRVKDGKLHIALRRIDGETRRLRMKVKPKSRTRS